MATPRAPHEHGRIRRPSPLSECGSAVTLTDLQRGRGRYVPVFEVDPRHDETLWELWMSGFERAMALRPESWARVVNSNDKDAVAALTGMQELIRISSDERDQDSEDQAAADALTQRAPDLIPPWIAA